MGFWELFLSVLAGVISAAVVFLMGVIINKVLIPWYQTISYDGVRVGGEWHCIDPTMAQEIVLFLKQRAGSLIGTATFIWDHEEGEQVRTYEIVRAFNVRGVIKDRFVQLTLTNSNVDRFGVNCYLLEVCGDGRMMEGVFSFYGITHGGITYSRQSLYRDRQLAEKIDGARKAERRLHRKIKLERELQDIEDEESGQLPIVHDDLPF